MLTRKWAAALPPLALALGGGAEPEATESVSSALTEASLARHLTPDLAGLSETVSPARDLAAVVDFYDARFHIGFSAQDKRDLVAFLFAL